MDHPAKFLALGECCPGQLEGDTSLAFSDEDSYRRFLKHRGERAQVHIDTLQRVCHDICLLDIPHTSSCFFKDLTFTIPPLAEHQWDDWLTALLRLSKCSSRLPSCLYVTDVRQVQPILNLRTPTTDVFRGYYQGQKVFMKRYRCCSGSLSLEDTNQVWSWTRCSRLMHVAHQPTPGSEAID